MSSEDQEQSFSLSDDKQERPTQYKRKKKKKKWSWQYSLAKEQLRKGLVSGKITLDMSIDDVFHYTPEVMKTDRKKFASRLRGLKEQVKADKKKANSDERDLCHDRSIYPIPTHNYQGEPRWEGSVAQLLLKQDVKNGRHETMSPKDLYNSRVEYYSNYSLSIIQHHIYQEVKLLKYINYRNDKKNTFFLQI